MNPFAIVSLLSFVVAIFLAGFIWFKKPSSVVSRIFAVSFILVAYCSFTEFGYRQTDNLETAYFWLKVGSFWPLVLATLLHFSLAYTGQSKLLKNRLTYALLYVPALVISLVDLTTNLIVVDFTMTKWGWTSVYSEGFISDLVAIWVIAIAGWATYLCWRYYFRTNEQPIRQQTKYVAIGISVAMIAGWLISEVLLPWLEIGFPGLGMSALAIGGIFIISAIWKHGFFSLSPAIAAEEILSTMSEFLFLVDRQGKMIRVNQAALRVLGYEENELIGQEVKNLFAEDINEETLLEEAKLADKPTMDVTIISETFIKTKVGKGIPISLSVSVICAEDGSIVGLLYVAQDITERKQAGEAREESYRRYKDLADFLPQAVFETDEVGNITFANRVVFETSGYTSEDVDKGMHGLQMMIPEDRDRFNEYMSRIMRGEEPSGIEITALNKNGNTFPDIILAARIIDGGKPFGARGVVVDITERKQAEQAREELYNREKELREKLEEEIRRRTEFTRVLVHELKTPLTPIIAASELLIGEAQEGTLLRLAESINRGASAMSIRIDALLDLARGEMGVLEFNYSEVDPVRLLHKVTDGTSSMASSGGLSFVLDVPSSIPSVWVDEGRLEQVILNLLTNAFKSSPQGGKVTLRARKKNDTLIVEVQDTGHGIAEENQEKIFEAYYRVESDRQRLDGLGLGLALCKTIVESHGGKIWVESEVGKGSTFSFSIPLSRS
ncbi:PAS domain S-box protein [Chloroflexota bacterium]